jgi:hypothetical protein
VQADKIIAPKIMATPRPENTVWNKRINPLLGPAPRSNAPQRKSILAVSRADCNPPHRMLRMQGADFIALYRPEPSRVISGILPSLALRAINFAFGRLLTRRLERLREPLPRHRDHLIAPSLGGGLCRAHMHDRHKTTRANHRRQTLDRA